MRTMANLVSDIMNLNSKDLDLLAQALAWYSAGTTEKAHRFETLLNVHNREQAERMKRMKEKVNGLAA